MLPRASQLEAEADADLDAAADQPARATRVAGGNGALARLLTSPSATGPAAPELAVARPLTMSNRAVGSSLLGSSPRSAPRGDGSFFDALGLPGALDGAMPPEASGAPAGSESAAEAHIEMDEAEDGTEELVPGSDVPASEAPAVVGEGGDAPRGEDDAVAATEEAPGTAGTGAAPGEASDAQPTGPPAPAVAPPDQIPADDAPRSPEDDPGFQAVSAQVAAVAEQERAHQPARTAADSAQAAAPGPPNETTAGASAAQVEQMDGQEPKPFDRAAFKQRLVERIADVAPKNPKDARAFSSSGKLEQLRGDLDGEVHESVEHSQGDLAQQTAADPDPSAVEPKPVGPLRQDDPGPPPPKVDAAAATPGPRPEADVSAPLQEGSQEIDELLAEEAITDEQLARANEPSFSSALAAKTETQAHAEQAPAAYRHDEAQRRAVAQADADVSAADAVGDMHGDRVAALSAVHGSQSHTMNRDQEERAAVAAHIEAIYERTKSAVEDRLDRLDEEVDNAFTDGAEAARQAFEDYVDDGLSDRYSGARGKARWAKDKVLTRGVPSAVARIFDRAREYYVQQMDRVIDRIVDVVDSGLSEAKQLIADGRREIAEYVDALPQHLQQVGQEAASDIQGRFDALEQSVDAKQDELIDSLAQRYHEQLGELDARIEELHAEHKGLLGKALDKIGGVVRTIRDLKNMLLDVLSSARDAVGRIIRDPIGFLGQLIKGVKEGLDRFVANIWKHLQAALTGWLFGTLQKGGLRLPKSLDAPGVLSLVMQVLGLTYNAVRSRAVKLLGEDMVARLEQFAEPFIVFAKEGPGGLWEWIKEKLSNLRETVVDQIKDWVVTRVIRAGVTWLVSMLNPAAAFIKAAKAIYRIVTFFVERGRQVAALVTAIVGSVSAIAKDAIGKAASFIEQTLGKSLTLIISFLANLIKLGGISEKIRGIIETVKAPVTQAVDWLIQKAVELVKTVGRFMGIGAETDVQDTAPPEQFGADDHSAFAQGAADLLKDASSNDAEVARSYAAEQEPALSAQLGEGIGLRYLLPPETESNDEGVLRFQVVIAPNTTTHDDELPLQDDSDELFDALAEEVLQRLDALAQSTSRERTAPWVAPDDLERAVTAGIATVRETLGKRWARPPEFGTRLHKAVADHISARGVPAGWERFVEQPLGEVIPLGPMAALTVHEWISQQRQDLLPLLNELPKAVHDQKLANLKPDIIYRSPSGSSLLWDLTSSSRRQHLAKTILYAELYARENHLLRIAETYWRK